MIIFFFSPLPSKLDLFPDPVDNMVSETVVMAQGLAWVTSWETGGGKSCLS